MIFCSRTTHSRYKCYFQTIITLHIKTGGVTIPKIIENLRERFLAQTRKELFENGYADVNIRRIAKACDSATGTVYNYFKSKDMLIANVVLEDWKDTIIKIENGVSECDSISSGLRIIYEGILSFNDMYRKIFSESRAFPLSASYPEKHTLLCAQISEYIKRVLLKYGNAQEDFTYVFISESFLTGSIRRWEYEKLEPVIKKILS